MSTEDQPQEPTAQGPGDAPDEVVAPPAEAPTAEPVAEEPAAEPVAEEPAAEPAAQKPVAEKPVEEAEAAPRAKPEIPGAHLEVDIVPEGGDALASSAEGEEGEAPAAEGPAADGEGEPLAAPMPQATIDLAAGARYHATGKRKTSVARVIIKPGTGSYVINGKELNAYFPRDTLQRTIRQPLETVGYEARMDVVAAIHGGGVSSQAGALRHGISRALLEADPTLRIELKRRGFLTRDARVKERKKAGLKKARKRPQFSKR